MPTMRTRLMIDVRCLGLAINLGGTVVSHASKTQHVVSLSTSEAECIAAGDGVKEALFARAVLSFVAPETSGASIKALEDSQGAKAMIENPLSSVRSKQIDLRSTSFVIYSEHGKSV